MSEIEEKEKPSFSQKAKYTIDDYEGLMIPDERVVFSPSDLDRILIHAYKNNVSDVTILGYRPIKFDLGGNFFNVSRHLISIKELEAFINRIHDTSGVATLNGGVALDKKYFIRDEQNPNISYGFRVHSVKTTFDNAPSYEITCRVIPSDIPYLKDMHLPQDLEFALMNFSKGIALVTGATGSGKSTLLAAIMAEFIRGGRLHTKKIITGEAPIEFDYSLLDQKNSYISQSEIPTDIATFQKFLEGALRRKPSIILVGEARDRETIEASVKAAVTGHEVYTTVHSNGFADTFSRMINDFPNDQKSAALSSLVQSVKVVVSQQLIKTGLKEGPQRIALREYVIITEEVKNILLQGGVDKIIHTSSEVLKKYGHSFLQDAEEKYNKGQMSKEAFESFCISNKLAQNTIEEKALGEMKEIELIKAVKKMQEEIVRMTNLNNILVAKLLNQDAKLALIAQDEYVERSDGDLEL